MQAMILAAGLGTRLWPLTADRGKPAVPFRGKPLILGVTEWLHREGVRRVVVNTHHRAESIHAALAAAPVSVRFVHEETILGTAGCLENAVRAGALHPDEETLIVNGKLVTDIALGPVLATHRETDAAVTMVLKPNPSRAHFREVRVEQGRVIGFGEGRIPTGPNPLLFTGIHLLAPRVLTSIPPGVSDTIKDVYPPFIEAGEVAAHVDQAGEWSEFSTLQRYLSLHGSGVFRSEGAKVAPGALVEDSVLWEGATVEAGAVVRRSILGRDVVVRASEVIEDRAVVLRDLVAGDARGQILGDRLLVPIEP